MNALIRATADRIGISITEVVIKEISTIIAPQADTPRMMKVRKPSASRLPERSQPMIAVSKTVRPRRKRIEKVLISRDQGPRTEAIISLFIGFSFSCSG